MTIALLGALVGATLSARALSPTPAADDAATPAQAMLGAYVRPIDGWSAVNQQDAVRAVESSIGRKLAIDHVMLPWGARSSSWLWRASWDLGQGRVPLLSFGSGVDTAAVARGDHDEFLRSLASAVASLGKPIFLRYAAKPDAGSSRSWVHSGTDYVAAWRHVRGLFAGVQAAWVWSPTAQGFGGAGGGVEQYWPGSGQVDWIAADGFNRFGCSGSTKWTELAELFQPFYAWGSAKGKPLMIAETGTMENPADPAAKARWFDNATRTLKSMPRVRAVLYYNSNAHCDWRVSSSASALDGFTRLAQDPWLQLPASTIATSRPSAPAPTTTAAPTTTRAPTTTVTSTTAPPTTQPPALGGVSGKLVPRSGALWGSTSVTDSLESRLGRRFDIAHTYQDWDGVFPTGTDSARADAGTIPFIDWSPRFFGSSRIVPWSSVASGAQDAVIDATAARVKSFGKPIFLSFHAEPEDEVGTFGSVADYAAAWRHVHDRFAAKGASNTVWVWNVMGYSGGYAQYTGGLYPGDAYVDWVAWDPYNWYGCRTSTWTSFGDKVSLFYSWLEQHGFGDKPFMLGEYGTPEGSSSGDKAKWFTDIVPALKNRLPNLRALVYFNNAGTKGCNWLIDSSSTSLQGFAQAGQDPYLDTR